MAGTVQARLDEKTMAEVSELAARKGWSTSRAVREALNLLLRQEPRSAASRMIGIGSVSFGPGDMATNKKYLEGLGRNSGIDASPKSRVRRKVG